MAERTWSGPDAKADAEWLDLIEADHDNVRAALVWFEQTGDTEALLRLAGALWPFWHRHSHRLEGRGWLERALEADRSVGVPTSARVRPLYGAAYLARNRGDYEHATALATECLRISESLSDSRSASRASQLLAFVALARGDYDGATVHATKALAISERLGEESRWTAWVLTDLGMAAFGLLDLVRAEEKLQRALELYHKYPDPFGTALTLGYLGLVACELGNHTVAAGRFSSSLPMWQQMGNRENQAEWLAGVATLAAVRADPERSARLFGAADELRDTLGHAFTLPERAAFERGVEAAHAALGGKGFVALEETGKALSLEQAVDEASRFLASIVEHAVPMSSSEPAMGPGLTTRELEVLRLLVAGRSNPQIAEKLFISPRTATTHVTNILAKLGVASRTEAATKATREGLV